MESELAGLSAFLLAGTISVCVFVLMAVLLSVRKSKQYRQVLADLFVSGKIKQLAKLDNIDIDLEFEEFKKWAKKEKRNDRYENLDDTIESELKEQVSEQIDNKIKK